MHGAFLFLSLFFFAYNRASDYKYRAQKAENRHSFAKNDEGQNHCGSRVNIA